MLSFSNDLLKEKYGGDEFIAVIYNTTKDEVTDILRQLDREIFEFNELGKAFKISYAHGCAFSSDLRIAH